PEIDKPVGKRLFEPLEGDFHPYLVTLSPDSKLALMASQCQLVVKKDGSIIDASSLELWDTNARKLLSRWYKDNYVKKDDLNGEYWKCLHFSQNGKQVVNSSTKGVMIWNVARGQIDKTLFERKWPFQSSRASVVVDQLAFSQDGNKVLAVASGNEGGSFSHGDKDMTPSWAALFAVETGEELRSWGALRTEGDWRSSTLSPDGSLVASGGKKGLIRLWDVATGRMLAQWAGHETGVTALIFHPDGKTLVSGARDGTLKLWNLPFIRQEL